MSRRVGANVLRGERRRLSLVQRLARQPEPPAVQADGSIEAVADALRVLGAADRELLTLIAWEATVDGLATDDAQALLGAVSTSGTDVRWDAAAAPGWTVVHQRTGALYDTSRHHLDWILRFDVAGVQRAVEVGHAYDDAIPVASLAVVGARLVSVGGHPAVVLPLTGGANADGTPVVSEVPVVVELAPGTIASGWARGDLAQVEALLASLTDTPADDPRLTELAGG